jgi:hypothetical protein
MWHVRDVGMHSVAKADGEANEDESWSLGLHEGYLSCTGQVIRRVYHDADHVNGRRSVCAAASKRSTYANLLRVKREMVACPQP